MTNNQVKIAAGINTFNDAKSLSRTLESLAGYVDRIYVIDGRYPDYRPTDSNEDKYSNDGTYKLVTEFGCKYGNTTAIEYHPLFAEQKEKRTKYLKLCEYDFLLAIDADEFMTVKSWSTFQDQLQRYVLNMPERHRNYVYQTAFQSEPNKIIYLGRVFYKPRNLIYTTHFTVIADPVDNRPVISSMAIDGIILSQNDLLRPYTRLQYDIDYQWALFLKERVITEKVYNDTECKENFANHVIWELNVWKDYYENPKPKIRKR